MNDSPLVKPPDGGTQQRKKKDEIAHQGTEKHVHGNEEQDDDHETDNSHPSHKYLPIMKR
jgi:hypothetical protein